MALKNYSFRLHMCCCMCEP